jgi:L-aspartate oxidase
MAVDPDEAVLVTQCWHEVRQVMWNYVGIVRSDKRLARARRRLELVEAEVREDYWAYTLTRDLIELRNIVTVGLAIIHCASMRRESRGLHYNLDCLEKDDLNWKRPTLLRQ